MFLAGAIYTDVRKGFREGSLIGKEDPNRPPGGRNDNVLGIEKMAGPREEVKVGDLLFITEYQKNDKQRIYVAEVGYFWCGEEHRGAKVEKLEDGRYAVYGGAYRYREYDSLEEIKYVSPAEAKAVEDYQWENKDHMGEFVQRLKEKREEEKRREGKESRQRVEKALELIRTTQEPFEVHRVETVPYIIVNGVHMNLDSWGRHTLIELIDYPSMKKVKPFLLKHDKEYLEKNVFQDERLMLLNRVEKIEIKAMVKGATWTKPKESKAWNEIKTYAVHLSNGETVEYDVAGVDLSASDFKAHIRKRIKRRVERYLNDPELFDTILDHFLSRG